MFEIPQSLFDTYDAAVNAMIDVNFGIRCTIYYPAESIPCPNCLPDNQNGKSSNIYNGSGPIMFQNTICPVCNGDGFSENEATSDIKLRCYFTPKHWIKLGVDVKIPDGGMQTIGHIEDLPNLRRSNYIVVNTNEGQYGTYKYRMYGEAQYHGFQRNKFFIANWSRMQ